MAQRPRQPETVNSDLHRRKGPTLVVLPSYGRDGLDDTLPAGSLTPLARRALKRSDCEKHACR
jgi:hypothetical protein